MSKHYILSMIMHTGRCVYCCSCLVYSTSSSCCSVMQLIVLARILKGMICLQCYWLLKAFRSFSCLSLYSSIQILHLSYAKASEHFVYISYVSATDSRKRSSTWAVYNVNRYHHTGSILSSIKSEEIIS